MRERRYICGRNRRAAQYQEVEIYQLPTDAMGRERDKEYARPPAFRGTPKAQANHNAKNARRWFHRLAVSNFTETQVVHPVAKISPGFLCRRRAVLRCIGQGNVQMRDACRAAGLPKPECLDVMAHFKNPAMPSVAVTADAAIKIASARKEFASTDTFLEMIGFDQADIRRIKAQEQRVRGQQMLLEVEDANI